MRAAVLVTLAAAAMLAAMPAVGQPARRHAPIPAPTPRPQKCRFGERLVLVGACSSPKPWRCEPCAHGVRVTQRTDRCGAPVEVCKTP